MLGLILGIGIPVGYVAVWTGFARALYQRYRIHEVEKANCPNRKRGSTSTSTNTYGYLTYSHDNDCKDCRDVNKLWWQDGGLTNTAKPYGTGDLLFVAFVQAFFWPLALPAYAMVRIVMVNPAPAPSELREREAAARKRIEELEELNRKLSDAIN